MTAQAAHLMMVSSQWRHTRSVGSATMSGRVSCRCTDTEPASVGRRATSTAAVMSSRQPQRHPPAISTGRASEQASHSTEPHSRQWCLRRKKPNATAQPGHSGTSRSSIHGTMACSYSASVNVAAMWRLHTAPLLQARLAQMRVLVRPGEQNLRHVSWHEAATGRPFRGG